MNLELHGSYVVTKDPLVLQTSFDQIDCFGLFGDWVAGSEATEDGSLLHVPNLDPSQFGAGDEGLAGLFEIYAVDLAHMDEGCV